MSFFTSLIRRITMSSRSIIGLVLIVSSIVGVVLVVRLASPGDRIILASGFIPAGTVITTESIREGRATDVPAGLLLKAEDILGRVVGVDVGEGEFISARMLEVAAQSSSQVSVPLGIEPPTTVARGTTVELWSVDAEGIQPPVSIARHAIVMSLSESGFGGDTVLTVRISPAEVALVLATIGSNQVVMATASDSP
jgi:hypothetical protein